MLYNFIIQYCQDSLNSADELLWRLNYITELSKECKDLISEQIENLMLMLVKKLATIMSFRADK